MAAPVATRTVSSSGSSNTITLSTLVVDGSDRFLIVTAGAGVGGAAVDRTVTSVTHHALACTNRWAGDDANFVRSEGWTRLAPDAGTWDVVVTWPATAGDQYMAGATLVNGAHQTVPLGTAASGGATNTANTIDVTSAVDELVIAGTMTDDQTGITAGGTQLWKVENLGSDSSGGAHWKPGAATVTMAWTQDIVGWASGGVPIKPVAAGGPTVAQQIPIWDQQLSGQMVGTVWQ